MAYVNAAWQRAEKMPALDDILEALHDGKGKKEKSPESMLDLVKKMNEEFGGTTY